MVFIFFFFLLFHCNQPDKNPAPGICLPIIVKFCQNHQVPYNYTIYPNYIGHFSQIEAEEDLEPYEAIVDVQCYELASLFLCTLFVPKCGTAGLIPPCKALCLGKSFELSSFPSLSLCRCRCRYSKHSWSKHIDALLCEVHTTAPVYSLEQFIHFCF